MRLKLKDGEPDFSDSWTSAREYPENQIKEIIDANLRDQFDYEVILDSESELHSEFVRQRLNKENWKYIEYKTGSRGSHFHLWFDGLKELSEKERIMYRELTIKDFKCDLAKKNGWIAMEYRPHFKTGTIKRVANSNVGMNQLNEDFIKKIKETIKPKKNGIILEGTTASVLRKNIKLSSLLSKWGIDTSRNPCDTPLAKSVRKRCLKYNDNTGLWYDFHSGVGGDIFTLVMKKENINFKEAKSYLEGLK